MSIFIAKKGQPVSLEYRYYISSKEMDAEQVAKAVREHWGIESMHWVLDVTMQEDACQIYKKNAAENLACVRHMALNMLRKAVGWIYRAGGVELEPLNGPGNLRNSGACCIR